MPRLELGEFATGFRMLSIALIGPDGAGKTTISRMLQESSLLPFKYIYMGINIGSSNVALPTSRVVQFAKRVRRSRNGNRPDGNHSRDSTLCRPAGRLWAAARLINRLAEEWYRQILSWTYQMLGYVALYDRHFVFDFASDDGDSQRGRLSNWLHRWHLSHVYPRPDLVIYLDAPAEVLFARKGESTLEDLEKRRQAFVSGGSGMLNFVRVDAAQPIEQVYSEVAEHIVRFCGRHNRRARAMEQSS